MKKFSIKSLCIILSVLIAIVSLPITAFALDLSDRSISAQTDESNSNQLSLEKEIVEIVDMRAASVKYFRLEDGSYYVAQYDSAVHYQDENGDWQDIDNTLAVSGSEITTSNAKIKFAKKTTGNSSLFTLHDGNRKLTLSLDGAAKKIAGEITNYETEFGEDATKLQKMTTLDKINASVIYRDILPGVDLEYVVTGLNIKENIIVKEQSSNYSYSFTMQLNNLTAILNEKGEIIISEPSSDEAVYIIPAPVMWDANNVTSDKATMSLTDHGNGKYTLVVTADSGWMNAEERAYPVTIDPPISVPASVVTDLEIASDLGDSNYSASSIMLVGQNCRSYWKVSELPYIPASAYITQATISLRSTSTNGNYVGAYQVTSNWDSTLTWNKTLASPAQGTLSTSVLDYNCIDGTSDEEDRYVWNITDLVRDWYSETANNYGIGFRIVNGTTSSDVSKFYTTNSGYTSYYPRFIISYKDMKGIEDYWTYSTQSAGFAGTGYVNYATGKLTFGKSLLSTTDSLMPYSPAFVYSSALANQKFMYPNAEVPFDDVHMPLGYKFSINETIIKRKYTSADGKSLYMYILSDEDGTEHYFLPVVENGVASTTKYQDDDGLQLILDASASTLTITDNSRNVRYYTELSNLPDEDGVLGGWYLSSIADAIGNKIVFGFGENARPNMVSLIPNGGSAIDFLTIAYNSNYLPYIIWNETAKEALIFRYSSTPSGNIAASSTNYLRKIEHVHATADVDLLDWQSFYENLSNNANIVIDATAEYTYDGSGYLTVAKDALSGYEIRYSYDSGGRVSAVQEYAGSLAGQTMYFTYYSGYTTVRSSGGDDSIGNSDDIITRYTFDQEGRVKSTYSTDYLGTTIYGATAGVYESQDNVKNNLKTTVVVGGSASTYLMNGGFENSTRTAADYWTKSSDNIQYYIQNVTEGSEKAANFIINDYISDSISQYAFLKAGKYTLSAAIYTYNCVNVSLFMRAESLTNSSHVFVEEIPLNEYYASDQSLFASMTFDVSNLTTNGGENFKISFFVESGDVHADNTGVYVSIDNVMLEKNIGASNYSMVQCGNFEGSAINSTGTTITSTSNFWSSQSGGVTTTTSAAPFDRVAYVSGEITKDKYIKQTAYTAPSTYLNDYDEGYFSSFRSTTYLVSGFAKGTGQVHSENSHFSLRVDVSYYQGSGNADLVDTYRFDFETDCKDWQFVYGSIKTRDYHLVRKIDVYCEYSYQPGGLAYFDEIAIYKNCDDSVVNYFYYENGLLWRKESGYHTEIYEYGDNKQLTRVANNRGQLTDYIYDSNGVTVDHEIEYTFEKNGSRLYPYASADPDAAIDKTPVTKTQYEYNEYGQMTSSSTFEVEYSGTSIVTKSGTEYVTTGNTYETTAGSHIFGALLREDDNRYIYTRYYYDQTNGRLLAVINQDEGTGTCYTYDAIGNVTSVLPATYTSATAYSPVTSSNSVDYTYNAANLLQSIKTDSTEYEFYYDGFGNTQSVTIGGEEIVNYEYNSFNGKLHTINYSNDFSVNYVYDALDNIKEVWYNDNGFETKAFEYHYTAYGQMSRFDNLLTGKSISYKYDSDNRLISYVEYDTENMVNTFASTIFYNEHSNPSSIFYSMDYYAGSSVSKSSIQYYHAYNSSDGTLNYYNVDTNETNGKIDYGYDGFKRLDEKVYDFSLNTDESKKFTNTVNYTFVNSPWNSTKTSSLVETVTSQVNSQTAVTYTYEYDYNGNVTKISLSNGTEYRYVYDDLGQLLREDNTALNRTYLYTYDNAGNILTKSTYALTAAGSTPSTLYSTYNYGYGDVSWGDKLTSYRGVSITYDDIGNPLSYYNGSSYTFSWENARQLATLTKGSYSLSFEYNNEGIRTSKTVNGVEHIYHLSNSLIMAEEWGNHLVLYLYDADGSPVGMQYRNTSYAAGQFDTFWFEKNLQGDVVAVYNHSGIKLIAYTYDAWGNSSVSYYNSGASTTATYNPFRYRGYYLDSESGFYYLNSRYYDPAIGRFITADKLSTIKATSFDLVDKNLYAYCDNNPITRTDDSGAIWETVFDIVSLGVSVVEVCVNPTDPWAWAGLVGDAVDLIPFVTGVGEVTRAVKTTKKIVDGVDNVVDAAKATYKAADAASDIRKATGTYEILYKSGKNYVGKGGFKRAISSAVRNADKYGDEVVSIMWKSNKNGVGAFLEEYALQTIRGVNNASTYNKIWSPGKKLYKALFG